MTNQQKIKQLLQSGQRPNQLIAINLMTSLNWSLDDCALFCFLNIKPLVFFGNGEKGWRKSQYIIGNCEIEFYTDHKEPNFWMRQDKDLLAPLEEKDYNYRCILSKFGHDILNGAYPMEGNPPVLEYFGAAVLLNLE